MGALGVSIILNIGERRHCKVKLARC
jgi:hypothetical protein